MNVHGFLPGREVIIIGSGDIGLIMARRMTLEGAKVQAVCEIAPHPGGLKRNIVQCLEDFGIPLLLSHTVTQIHGRDRINGVIIAKVDNNWKPIPGTEKFMSCDTLLLSVGLIPENELAQIAGVQMDEITSGAVTDQDRETSQKGIFACGNALHVHDLADYASEEAEIAGRAAANYILNPMEKTLHIPVIPGDGVRYTVPQFITSAQEDVKVYFRAKNVCKNSIIRAQNGKDVLAEKKVLRIIPSEMETIILPKDRIGNKISEVKISIQEVES